jgi:hypothetical protein
MRILSFITVILIVQAGYSQSPHEKSLKYDCSYCHQSTDWRVIPSKTEFNHNETSFPLTGQHNSVDCRSCHGELKFVGTLQNCSSCHKDIHMNTLGLDCARCHTPQSWVVNDVTNLHQMTRFPLTGVHLQADCQDCHSGFTNLIFEVQGVRCFDCHNQDYLNTTNPNHVTAGFSTECQDCHSLKGNEWSSENFNHDFFPLTGAHSIGCFSCHTQGVFTGLSSECVQCHQPDFNTSVNPNHTALAIPVTCQDCHSLNPDWQPALFPIHNNYYPLEGAHAALLNNCGGCHNGNYNTTPNTCIGCHTNDFNSTTNPPHQSAGFSTDCTTCHSQNAWIPSTFDHDARFFPIYSGEHQGEWTNCSDCHTTPSNFAAFSCIDCHEHNQTDMDDEHEGIGGYVYASPQCYSCHPTGDAAGSFNHSLSQFPLTGAHINVNCQSCHQTGYAGTTTVCFDCHQNNFVNAANPNHQSLGISTECTSCHTTLPGWEPALFPQHDQHFALTGSHISQTCTACHNGGYTNTPNQCTGCHQDDYNAAPDHASQNYPLDCSMCHTATLWNQTNFNHSTTAFPLTGSHINVNCQSCHQTGFTGTTTICADCHQQDYNNSSNPSHTALQLSSECSTCHTTNVDWQPATFADHNNFYPLLGAHSALLNDCYSCHNGNYVTTPNTCYGCHESDFIATTNPNHQTAGFPIECQSCHTQNVWAPSTFNHDNLYFPIYSGRHQGEWNLCSDCHTNPSNFSLFSCIDCHEHNQTDMDDEHDDVGGYVYESNACFSCHPDGEDKSIRPSIKEFR